MSEPLPAHKQVEADLAAREKDVQAALSSQQSLAAAGHQKVLDKRAAEAAERQAKASGPSAAEVAEQQAALAPKSTLGKIKDLFGLDDI